MVINETAGFIIEVKCVSVLGITRIILAQIAILNPCQGYIFIGKAG